MTVTAKTLIDPIQPPAAQTLLYTSPPTGKGTIVDKFTGTNPTGAAATLTVNLVKLAGAAGAANTIVSAKSLAPGEAYTFPELVGHVLGAGDFISVLPSAAASITVRSSGRELS